MDTTPSGEDPTGATLGEAPRSDDNHLAAAGGLVHLALGRHEDALQALDGACRHAEASRQNVLLAETLLPLAEAAAATGAADVMAQSFDALLPLIPGMRLPRAALHVRLLCGAGAFDEARGVVGEL